MTNSSTPQIAIHKTENCDTIPATKIPLRCACCGLPFGFIVQAETGWYIEIASKHNGEKHTNIIPMVSPVVTAHMTTAQNI